MGHYQKVDILIASHHRSEVIINRGNNNKNPTLSYDIYSILA